MAWHCNRWPELGMEHLSTLMMPWNLDVLYYRVPCILLKLGREIQGRRAVHQEFAFTTSDWTWNLRGLPPISTCISSVRMTLLIFKMDMPYMLLLHLYTHNGTSKMPRNAAKSENLICICPSHSQTSWVCARSPCVPLYTKPVRVKTILARLRRTTVMTHVKSYSRQHQINPSFCMAHCHDVEYIYGI